MQFLDKYLVIYYAFAWLEIGVGFNVFQNGILIKCVLTSVPEKNDTKLSSVLLLRLVYFSAEQTLYWLSRYYRVNHGKMW